MSIPNRTRDDVLVRTAAGVELLAQAAGCPTDFDRSSVLPSGLTLAPLHSPGAHPAAIESGTCDVHLFASPFDREDECSVGEQSDNPSYTPIFDELDARYASLTVDVSAASATIDASVVAVRDAEPHSATHLLALEIRGVLALLAVGGLGYAGLRAVSYLQYGA